MLKYIHVCIVFFISFSLSPSVPSPGIVGTLMLLILIILLIVFAKSICISIAIIQEASK